MDEHTVSPHDARRRSPTAAHMPRARPCFHRRSTLRRTVAALTTVVLHAAAAAAQTARQTYPLDLGSAAPVTGPLPFDVEFVFTGAASKEVRHIGIAWTRKAAASAGACATLRAVLAHRDLAATVDSVGRATREVETRLAQLQQRRAAETPEREALLKQHAGELEDRLRRLKARRAALASDSQATRKAPPEDSVSFWTRRDTLATTFSLVAGPLDPNVRYSFCVRTLRKLTRDELTTFRGDIATKLSGALLEAVADKGEFSTADSRAFQAAAAEAVPRESGYVIDYGGPDAFLRPRDLVMETLEEMERRDAVARARFGEFLTAANQRNSLANDLHVLAKCTASALVRLDTLHAAAKDAILAADAVLVGTPRPVPVPVRLDTDRERFNRARLAAGVLLTNVARDFQKAPPGTTPVKDECTGADRPRAPRAREGLFRLVALGATPIARPDAASPEPDFGELSSPEQLAPLAATLDSSYERLRDLQAAAADVSALVTRRPRALAVTPAQMQAFLDSLRVVGGALEAHRNMISQLRASLAAVQAAAAKVATTLAVTDVDEVYAVGTTEADYVTNARRYVGLDVGLLYASGFPGVNEFEGGAAAPYLGANFYFRPVNKNASLKRCPGWCTSRRLSVTLGLTTSGIKREKVRDNLFGSQSALLGAGWRATDYLRATTGGLVFKSFAANGAERVSTTPFLSLSLDYDARSALGEFFTALFPGLTKP